MTLPREELLDLLGPTITAVAREVVQRVLTESSLTQPVGATVVSASDADGTALVRIDGDPSEETTPAMLTGLPVAAGDRVAVILGQSMSYVLGGFGEAIGGGSVDLTNYVTFSALNARNFDGQVTSPDSVHTFVFHGDAVGATSPYPQFVFWPQAPLMVAAVANVAPTGAPALALNCDWNDGTSNTSMLNTNLTLTSSSAAGTVFTSTDFAVTQCLPPPSSAGLLRPRIVTPDGGNTGAEITFALWTRRIAS